MGGAHQRRPKEVCRGSKLIEIGSYGGGSEGNSPRGSTGAGRQRLGLAAMTCFLAR
jgi:hypothetical protein